MSEHPENESDEPEPIRGQVRYSQVSARVPEDVGEGCFASAVMVMSGPFEHVLDFVLRLSEQPRVVARVVLPPTVVAQFLKALRQNIANFETNFGSLPKPPQPVRPNVPETDVGDEPREVKSQELRGSDPAGVNIEAPPWSTHPTEAELQEPGSEPVAPNIEQIYDDLRLPDSLLSGRYANAVLIRHSPTEFCFDFITNIFPRSSVSCRVYMAAANVAGLLGSLERSLQQRPQ